eukprot:COSAG06_NODE_9256_length_1945_cov_2.793608_1_plen_506_part_10
MAAAAAMAGAHGLDLWLGVLRGELASTPEPRDVPTALAPMAAFGVDVDAVLLAVTIYKSAPEPDWHPDDWRRSHPEFPTKYALVINVYSMQMPNVYAPLGEALRGTDRDAGPGGVSPRVRAFLPFAKLLDVALVAAARVWGPFVGQVFRGVKYAFPEPTLAAHDPEVYFPPGRELNWFAFQSSSTKFDVMYQPWFCGKSGPRTVFTIQSIEGVSIKRFSALPDEDEVLFRPLARFRVTGSAKKLTPADLGLNPPASGGFPDDVHLQQLPSRQELAELEPEPEPEWELEPEPEPEPEPEGAPLNRHSELPETLSLLPPAHATSDTSSKPTGPVWWLYVQRGGGSKMREFVCGVALAVMLLIVVLISSGEPDHDSSHTGQFGVGLVVTAVVIAVVIWLCGCAYRRCSRKYVCGVALAVTLLIVVLVSSGDCDVSCSCSAKQLHDTSQCDLAGASVSGSVEPLAALTQLTYLRVDDTSVSGSVEPLAALTQLEHLDLGWTSVSGSVEPL